MIAEAEAGVDISTNQGRPRTASNYPKLGRGRGGFSSRALRESMALLVP